MADNVTTEELELALEQLAEGMGLSVVEYVNSLGYATVSEVGTHVSDLQGQIDAIIELDAENGVESLAEKVAAINAVLSDENGVIQAIYTKIQENTAAIGAETARATGVEADLQSQITGNTTALTALTNRVAVTEADLAILKGDDTVVGSVANLIKTERERAEAAESDLQAQITAITGGEAGSISDVLQQAKDYSDANKLKAASMDMCKIGNKFRFGLGLADATCGGTEPEGDGLVI